MGLDTVELVVAFEEKFDIRFSDDEIGRIVTVRDVIDYVYDHVPHAAANVCLTQRAFHRLRRAVLENTDVDRSQIRPTTAWDSLIAVNERQDVRQRLHNAVGAEVWQTLHRSDDLFRLISAASLATAAAVLAASEFNGWIAAASGLAAATLLALATRPFRLHFSKADATVGRTVEMLVARLPAEILKGDARGWTRDQVRAAVRAVVVDHLGVEPTFSDDASFVDDLGAD